VNEAHRRPFRPRAFTVAAMSPKACQLHCGRAKRGEAAPAGIPKIVTYSIANASSRRHASTACAVSWAPSHDKSVELFSRASVPPAIVSKDDLEWNFVLADIVRGEHIDDGAFLGRSCAVPFRFGHSSPLPRGLKRRARARSRPPRIGSEEIILPDTRRET